MIRILRSHEAAREEILSRGEARVPESVERDVREILAAVRAGGDAAVMALNEKFGAPRQTALLATPEEIEEGYAAVDERLKGVLARAKENIEAFHRRQKREGFIASEREGIVLGQRILPIARAGLYVPGGTASYPSTVLMNAIPAKIAGVPTIVMATPPGPDGKIAPAILAAAKIAGVTTIVKAGGAQAIAALAYGTQSVPRVDKIVGPGNIYVATAKRQVYGQVDIDMIAGPSEILVVADAEANPAHWPRTCSARPSTTGYLPPCWCAIAWPWRRPWRRKSSGNWPFCRARKLRVPPSKKMARSSWRTTCAKASPSPTNWRPSIWNCACATRSPCWAR